MSIIKQVEEVLKKHITNAGFDIEKPFLEVSNRKDLGQYQLNDAMQLAKKYQKNPREIAEAIKNEIEKDKNFINVNIAGPGFINITFSEEFLVSSLNSINNDIKSNIDKKEPKKVIIDYGGANVAKALHVGHLRSANIGEALKRLAILLGYDIKGDAHLGDYGRPLGFVIKEIKERYPNLEFFNPEFDGDYNSIELPLTNKDLEELYPIASNKAKEDELYLEDGREITAKIQNHEKGYYDLWKRIVEISKKDINELYTKLNVHFEIWNGESDEMEYFGELKEICKKSGLLKYSDGAQIIEIAEEDDKAPMPPLMLVRSNQTASYAATDLSAILERKKNENPDEIWYVVDNRQSLHFEQVFRTARKLKLVDDNVKLEHVEFGTMNGKDGKPFKTRDGGVMTLKMLMDLVKEEVLKRVNSSVTEEEKQEIADIVSIGVLKYSDLLPYRGTDYIFEVEKFADLEGKTGSYILYSTIRMKSLLEKAKEYNAKKVTKLMQETEQEIALTILNMPVVLTKSIESKSLNEIAEYLYNLTALYNKFYSENKILTEEDIEKRESWIVLTDIVYKTNCLLLDVLGIEIPQKM